jgi:hypothetical protein
VRSRAASRHLFFALLERLRRSEAPERPHRDRLRLRRNACGATLATLRRPAASHACKSTAPTPRGTHTGAQEQSRVSERAAPRWLGVALGTGADGRGAPHAATPHARARPYGQKGARGSEGSAAGSVAEAWQRGAAAAAAVSLELVLSAQAAAGEGGGSSLSQPLALSLRLPLAACSRLAPAPRSHSLPAAAAAAAWLARCHAATPDAASAWALQRASL